MVDHKTLKNLLMSYFKQRLRRLYMSLPIFILTRDPFVKLVFSYVLIDFFLYLVQETYTF